MTVWELFNYSRGTEDEEDLREVCPKGAHPSHRLYDQDGHQYSSPCPYSPVLASCDFWLFPKIKKKLQGCGYETIEEIKVIVMKVIDTLTQQDFHGAFQKTLELYNKSIAAGGHYFEGTRVSCVYYQ